MLLPVKGRWALVLAAPWIVACAVSVPPPVAAPAQVTAPAPVDPAPVAALPVARAPVAAPPQAPIEPSRAGSPAGQGSAIRKTGAAGTDAAKSPPPLPKGTTVLHIGDSFAGALGIDLDKQLKAAGVHGILRYKTASFIPEWAYGGKVRRYISEYKPDLVIISLGANELKITDPERRAKAIHKLVAQLGGRPCVWIGAPLWSSAHNDLLNVIRDNAKPCRFLDSTHLFPDMPRVGDHIHPTMNARREWARRVVDWLARERVPDADRPWELKPVPATLPPLADVPAKKK